MLFVGHSAPSKLPNTETNASFQFDDNVEFQDGKNFEELETNFSDVQSNTTVEKTKLPIVDEIDAINGGNKNTDNNQQKVETSSSSTASTVKESEVNPNEDFSNNPRNVVIIARGDPLLDWYDTIHFTANLLAIMQAMMIYASDVPRPAAIAFLILVWYVCTRFRRI
jgi:hypothetical protein